MELLSLHAYEKMLVMSSVVFSADNHSVNTLVNREGSHSAPLTTALNHHAPAACESDCDSSELQTDGKSEASDAIVLGGASKVCISVTHLEPSIYH